jgi:hypothetical protein
MALMVLLIARAYGVADRVSKGRRATLACRRDEDMADDCRTIYSLDNRLKRRKLVA